MIDSRSLRKGRRRTDVPARVEHMSKELLEVTLRKKKECNAKALLIVERLLEETVSKDWLLDCLKFINKSHFEDVVEERAIISLCGYPLCGHRLKSTVAKQYHISTKLNKVYDITERKNFCSNYCYAAAKFLAKQLLTSPLWIHDREEIPTFKLLPSTVYRNPAGEEVDFGVIRLDAGEKQRTTKPVDKAENPDIFEHSSNIAEIKEASDGYKNVTLSSTNILSHSAGYLNSSKTVSGEIEGVSSNLQIIENKVDFKNIIIPNKGIQDCDETLKDLSAHKVSAIESEPARGCENKPPISTPTPTHGKNTTLSQYSSPRNDRLQKTHTNKGVVQEPAMRSVVLRIETCLKEWFTVHTVKLLLGEDICQGLQQLNITEETGPVLPLVDLHAQNALRRRIVLDRLNRVLPEMLAALGLSDCDIATDVRELVGSFSLSAHNITFHPAEWNFLGLIIIHSLSIKNKTLRFQLNTDKVKKYLTMILLSFEQDGNYLENLIAWLTEPYCVESKSR